MDVVIYKCKYDSKEYTIRHAIIQSTGQSVIDVLQNGNYVTQYFVCNRLRRVILSAVTFKNNEILAIFNTIIHRYLSKTIECIQIQSFTTLFIYFSVQHVRFRVNIKDNPFNYNVKIGSNAFNSCVDVNINKPIEYNKPQKLMQIYSEPECWHDLVKGNTIDMIKGSLQFIQTVFDVHSFVFEDNSNIDCGITDMSQKPPRKLSTPFSLGHLFLVTKNETWYEYNFGAVIANESEYASFKSRISIFNNPKTLSTHDFFRIANMTREQQEYLESLYEKAHTWRDFFTSVPKNKQCFAFYNWLPFFIDEYLLLNDIERKNEKRFGLRHMKWKIDMFNEKFKRTGMIIDLDPEIYKDDVTIPPPQKGSGYSSCNTYKKSRRSQRRKTLKHTWKLLSFSSERAGQTI